MLIDKKLFAKQLIYNAHYFAHKHIDIDSVATTMMVSNVMVAITYYNLIKSA